MATIIYPTKYKNRNSKIVTIIGTRPQFIKIALVSKALKLRRIREVIIHTGQHYDSDLSDIFFKELKIPQPDYNLKVGSGSHAEQLAKMLPKIEKILLYEKPKIVLVYGDTNSTLAGALAAAKLKIKIAHIEAGLRSLNRNMAEEINRIITDSISSIFFCPTRASVDNLRNEGKLKGVYLVGDVMYDTVKKYLDNINSQNRLGKYMLCTIHRAENTDYLQNLRNIFRALSLIKSKIIIPLHPRTAKFLKKYGIKIANNIKIIKPVSYREMLNLEKHARLIITDSGGVQKEAFIFNVPCVTLRKETEWVETLKEGLNFISGVSVKGIITAVNKALQVRAKINPTKFYGDGFAHREIVNILIKELYANK